MKYATALMMILLATFGIEAKVVKYELTATQGEVNLSGKKKVDFALMLNGGIPFPTLTRHQLR